MTEWETLDLQSTPVGKLLHSARWKPLLELNGLDEVTADRLLRLLLTHLTLDRVITSGLALRLVMGPSTGVNLETLSKNLAELTISKRAKLCVALGIASKNWKNDFDAFNAVRNRLSHFNPKVGLDQVKELHSEKAFEECIQRGLRALQLNLPKSA